MNIATYKTEALVMKVLIATDGSVFSRAAIEEACKLVLTRPDSIVRIVSAYDPTVGISAEPYVGTAVMYQQYADSLKLIAENAGSDAAKMVHQDCPTVNVNVDVVLGRPAQSILEVAEHWKADLIVVGSHGHGFLGRTLLGSVSNAVVHNANCPVLVVRSTQAAYGKNS